MNKKSQSNMATSRVLKSKYLEREKHVTIPMRKKGVNNLKITDLCPQDKIKIGELIKMLQTRRVQNLDLQRDNQKLKEDINEFQGKLDEMQNQSLEKQSQIADLKDKIIELKDMIDLYEQKLRKMNEVVKASSGYKNHTKGVQTQQITTKIANCQTLQLCSKEVSIQTDNQADDHCLLYQANSKSFEKIMKGTLSKQLQKEFSSGKTESAGKTSCVMRSDFNHHRISPENNSSDSSCESLGQIEQKWNLLKMKNQAELATSKQLNSVHQFESSSPSRNSSSLHSQNSMEIDGITLNRMIKKTNFSANALMKTQKRREIKKDSHQVSYLKSPYFNRPQVDTSQLKPLTNQSYNDSKSKPSFRLNFYESGLSDMGSSLR